MKTPTVAEAWEIVESCIQYFDTERVPLAAAAGRVLREALRADRDFPPFDRVTMDGYAVRAAEAAPGAVLRVAGLAAAGAPSASLPKEPGLCMEIMTGAPMPEGADAVVPYEDVSREGEDIRLCAGAGTVRRGANVHARGGDFASGAELVPAGVCLTGREIAVAAACGAAEVVVSARPAIALLSTGDELVPVERTAVAPWQIRRSNDLAVRAALEARGFPGAVCVAVPDDRAALDEALGRALESSRVVVVTGGVSQGRFDFLPEALGRAGVQTRFRGVRQRPGKPMTFGVGGRGQWVFALPGNPVSAFACLHRYVLPALERASGRAANGPHPVVALAKAATPPQQLTQFLPVALIEDPADRGRRLALPRPVNTSGDFAHLVATDGFVELAEGCGPFGAGALVPFFAWS